MTNQSQKVDEAIKNLLDEYQKLADEEKVLGPKRLAAGQKVQQLVDDMAAVGKFDEKKVTSESVAAFLVFQSSAMQRMAAGDMSAQATLAKFDQDYLSDLDDYLKNLQGDQAKVAEIQKEMGGFVKVMQPPKVQRDFPMFDIAMSEPLGDHGDWTVAVVPIVVDKNYQAKVLDKMDFDLYLSMEVTPRSGLSGKFNIPAQFTKAGDKYEPLAVTETTTDKGPMKNLHIRGSVYEKGQLVQELDFPTVALTKQPPAMDLNALMGMLGGGGPNGPGPNGPH